MRLRTALLALAAAALPLAASPAMAATPDHSPPTIQIDDGVHLKTGSVLSDSTSSASVMISMDWRQFDTGSGICGTTMGKVFGYVSGVGFRQIGEATYSGNVGTGSVPFASGGYRYFRLDVSTQDCAGNAGTATNYGYPPQLSQESAASFGPGWTTSSCNCFSGYAVLKSTKAGASATYSFSGSHAIGFVSDYATNRGTAKIYIDGSLKATVNENRATSNRVIVWSAYYKGTSAHELKIVTSGRVDFDAVLTNG